MSLNAPSSPAPVVNAGSERSRHLVRSSKNSILLHRTAAVFFSCVDNWTLTGAKMVFLC